MKPVVTETALPHIAEASAKEDKKHKKSHKEEEEEDYDMEMDKAEKKRLKKEQKAWKKQLKTGIKTFGDEDIESSAYDYEQDYSTWRYQNPRLEQRGPVHSARMFDDQD